MVSNASDDFPDPETPVITVNWLWGIESGDVFQVMNPRAADVKEFLHGNEFEGSL